MLKIFKKIRREVSSQVSAFYESTMESWLGSLSALKKIPEAIWDFFTSGFQGIGTARKSLTRLPRRMVKKTGDFFWVIADNLGVQLDSLKTLKRPFSLIGDFFSYLFWALVEGFKNTGALMPRLPKLVLRGTKSSVLMLIGLPVFLVVSAYTGTVAGLKAIFDRISYLWNLFTEDVRDVIALPGHVVEQRRRILRRLTSRLAILVAVLLLLAGSGLAGTKYLALPAYREWKQENLLARARGFLENDDIRGAILTTHQVLRTNYNNPEANRLMAEIGDRIGTNESLFYRERFSILAPDDYENRFLWAEQAVARGNFNDARRALDGLPPSPHDHTRVLWVQFQIAQGEDREPDARSALEAILRQDPEHGPAFFELLLANLKGNDVLEAERARLELVRIAHSPDDEFHVRARREVILDDLKRGLMIEAIPLAQMIRENPESSFFDRLLALTTFRRTGFRLDHANYLQELQEEASTDPNKALMMAELMMRNRDYGQLISWSGSFTPEVRGSREMQMQLSGALLQSRRWQELEQYLRPLDWRERNFHKHAKLARAYREMERTGSFETEWRLAQTGVRTAGQLRVLLNLARDWGWVRETESLMWVAIDRFPNESWPTVEIINAAIESGRTESLWRILREMVRRDPSDIFARNDLARLQLLQHRGTEEGHAAALSLYNEIPNNLRITMTYALSLHLQGRTEEAISLFDEFPPDQIRQNPSASLYLGLLLAFGGRNAEAREFLDDLPNELNTLPEEKRLIMEARELLASSSS